MKVQLKIGSGDKAQVSLKLGVKIFKLGPAHYNLQSTMSLAVSLVSLMSCDVSYESYLN
eukprot:m.61564 g.61564  ORF g.61564 m.61564 type:complete len:59 (-) comp13888_c0_seq3:816-992(-)